LSNEIEAAVNTKADALKEWQRPLLVSLLFCDSCSLREDSKADVIGIFDRIYVHPETRVTPLFMLFVRTAETTGEMVRVICRAPDGRIPTLVEFMAAPSSEFSPNLPANVQGIVTMNPFLVHTEGVYWFDVSFKGQSLGGAALVIEFRETEDRKGGTDTYV
jgi:hypothetical protein